MFSWRDHVLSWFLLQFFLATTKTARTASSPDRRPSLEASRLLLQSAWGLKGPGAKVASRAMLMGDLIDLIALYHIVWDFLMGFHTDDI